MIGFDTFGQHQFSESEAPAIPNSSVAESETAGTTTNMPLNDEARI